LAAIYLANYATLALIWKWCVIKVFSITIIFSSARRNDKVNDAK